MRGDVLHFASQLMYLLSVDFKEVAAKFPDFNQQVAQRAQEHTRRLADTRRKSQSSRKSRSPSKHYSIHESSFGSPRGPSWG
jgi:hypothetical protein